MQSAGTSLRNVYESSHFLLEATLFKSIYKSKQVHNND